MKKFWIIFFSFLFSLNLYSSWEKDYLLGFKKFEKKEYIEAIKLFEKAIREKPNSCDKCIREGMFFYDYYPHFYLAKCYLALEDNENFQRSIDFLKKEGKMDVESITLNIYQNLQFCQGWKEDLKGMEYLYPLLKKN
ncbi:MAG: hypothetical protein WHV67_08095, partial [Thermoanaerobaculia bacterium]